MARGNYAPQSYHDFIGFQVSKEVLERAFRDTYTLEMKDIFNNLDLALGTFSVAAAEELAILITHSEVDEEQVRSIVPYLLAHIQRK